MGRAIPFIIHFLLIVPTLVFFTDLTRNPYYFQIVLLNAVTVVLWMVWVWRARTEGKVVLRSTPIDIPLWSFVAVVTIAWLWALGTDYGESYIRYSVYSEGLKRWLYTIVNCVLPMYAAVYFIDDNKGRESYLNTVFLAAFVASVYAIMQYMGIEPIWPHVLNPFGGRSVSTFGNPNFLSSYLVMVIPLTLAFVINAESAGARIWAYVLMLITFVAELCTLTRSSWLGLGVGLLLFALLVWLFNRDLIVKNKKNIAITLAIFISLGMFWPQSTVGGKNPSVVERLTEAMHAKKDNKNYGSVNQRQLIWSCAASMVLEKPVIGKGWGCFELFYPFYQGKFLFLQPFREFRTHANNAHNEILEIWSQAGTLGMGVYLWLLVCLYFYAFRLIKSLSGANRIVAIAFTSALAGMWIDNLLNVSLHFAVPGFLYWWFMGNLLSLGPRVERVKSVTSAAWRGTAVVLVIIGSLIIVRYGRCLLGEIHYFKGFKYSKQGNVSAAIPELEADHRIQRFEVNNNYELANCYARAGMRDKALEMYMESLRANAGYDEIYFNLATVLMQKGNATAAIPEYTQSLNINPLSWDGYNALGSLFLQDESRYGMAGIEVFKQYVLLQPGNRDIWNNLGYLYTKRGMHEQALESYKKAVAIDPDFDLGHKNLEVTLKKLGRRDKEYDEFVAIIRSADQGVMSKNWAVALPVCQKFVERSPRSLKARFYLGNVYFTTGKLHEAIEQYRAGLSIDPNNTTIRVNLALALAEIKNYPQAIEEFTAVLKREPTNQIARTRLDALRNQNMR